MNVRKHLSFCWVLLALFFGAQLLVAQHTSEFGAQKHTHHSQECSFHLFTEQAKSPSAFTLLVPPAAVLLSSTESLPAIAFVASAFARSLFARAPPHSIV